LHRSLQGKTLGYLVCWLLGNGCLFSWNSLLTVEDYFETEFPVISLLSPTEMSQFLELSRRVTFAA
jgi:hypothetical protein